MLNKTDRPGAEPSASGKNGVRIQRCPAFNVRLVDADEEQVLVIFGAGHLGWLRHDVASDPTVRLRTLAEFVQ